MSYRYQVPRKRLVVLLIGFCLASILLPPRLDAGWGEVTAPVLEMGAGAELPAMGGAGQAAINGPAALHYNPAGIMGADGSSMELSYQSMMEGITYSNLDYLASPGADNNWAAGLRYVDYGSVDETDYRTREGGLLETKGSFTDVDVVLSGAYGGRWNENTTWGVATRLFNLELAQTSASGLAIDGGLQWRSPELPVAAGATVKNLGMQVEYVDESEDLPLLVSAGGSFDLQQYTGYNLRLHGDLEQQINESEFFPRLGGEWRTEGEYFRLRLGYDGSNDTDDGVTYGFGLYSERNNLKFDYALISFGEIDDMHRFSLTYRFF